MNIRENRIGRLQSRRRLSLRRGISSMPFPDFRYGGSRRHLLSKTREIACLQDLMQDWAHLSRQRVRETIRYIHNE